MDIKEAVARLRAEAASHERGGTISLLALREIKHIGEADKVMALAQGILTARQGRDLLILMADMLEKEASKP